MKGRALLPLVTVAAALTAAGVGHAGPPGRWTVILQGSGAPTGVSELGVLRTAGGVLHVAWRQETSPLAGDIRVGSISAAGQAGPATTVVSGWSLAADPALVAAPGGMRVFFAAGSPIEGLLSATAPVGGAPWSAPLLVVNEEFSRARTPGVTATADGTPLETWYSAGDIVVHRGVSPGPVHQLTAGGTNIRPNIVTDSSGGIWVSWCRFQGAPLGVLVQQVDPASGAPAGQAFQLPGSTTDFQGTPNPTCVLESVVNRREPMAARVGGGVYVAGTAGYPGQDRVLVWRIDGAGPVSTITVAQAANVSHDEPALAAAPDGRIWAAWIESAGGRNRIVARRSNRAGTVFGARVIALPSGGLSNGSVNLSAQADRVDLLALVATTANVNTLQHTQLLPALSLTSARSTFRAGKRQAIVFRALDAGEPVAGVRVALAGKSSVTNAAGRATIVLTPRRGARTLRATASKPGYSKANLTLRGK